jgi:hypothetical protein
MSRAQSGNIGRALGPDSPPTITQPIPSSGRRRLDFDESEFAHTERTSLGDADSFEPRDAAKGDIPRMLSGGAASRIACCTTSIPFK